MCNSFTRNGTNSFTDCSTVYMSSYILLIRSKTCKVSRVLCKRKADPCKLLFVQKSVRTRVNGISEVDQGTCNTNHSGIFALSPA